MSAPREFIDTNVLVYAFTHDARAARAQGLLDGGCVIGVQVLNEFANVARRKLGMTWDETGEALAAVQILCPTIVPLTVAIHASAVTLARRHELRIFDALIVAAALDAR